MAFTGDTKGGSFDVQGDQAREWLCLPANPNGRTNADVLRPWVNGMDLTRRSAGKWIVDFGWTMSEGDAALYEEPFRWVQGARPANARAKPPQSISRVLVAARRAATRACGRALGSRSRYIATPHRREAPSVRVV